MYNLYTAIIELSKKCNAKCIHCFANGGSAKENELTQNEIFNLLEDFSDLGCKIVVLSGGEPLLLPNLPLIIQKVQFLGMRSMVVSNGLLLDDSTIKMLNMFKSSLSFGISLDGPDAKTHDYIRGVNGCFEKAMEYIPKILETDISFSVVTTAMQSNIDKLDEIKDLLLKLGVKAWLIQIVKPCERVPKEELLTEEQYYRVAEKIVSYRKTCNEQLKVYEADCIGYNSKLTPNLYIQNWHGCECGISSVSVDCVGEVKGCPAMNNSEGNIRKIPFKEIWANHKNFSYNRNPNIDSLKGFCNQCEYKYTCRGGCPLNPVTKNGSAYCLYKIETIGEDE